MPEPLYYYRDSTEFYPYRGAVYLRWYNDTLSASYDFASLSANYHYQSWLDSFIDKTLFQVAYDAGCLVLLLYEEPKKGSYGDAHNAIRLIEKSLGKDDKLLWAIHYNDETPITTKTLEDLRTKVLSGISGDIYYQNWGGDTDIAYGKEIEHSIKPAEYDYWEEEDLKIYKECCEKSERKTKVKNPFESYFSI